MPTDDSEYFYKPPVGAYLNRAEVEAKIVYENMWHTWKDVVLNMEPENMYLTAAKALAKCFDIDVRKAVIGPEGSVYIRTLQNEVYECVVNESIKDTRLFLKTSMAIAKIPALIVGGFWS